MSTGKEGAAGLPVRGRNHFCGQALMGPTVTKQSLLPSRLLQQFETEMLFNPGR